MNKIQAITPGSGSRRPETGTDKDLVWMIFQRELFVGGLRTRVLQVACSPLYPAQCLNMLELYDTTCISRSLQWQDVEGVASP